MKSAIFASLIAAAAAFAPVQQKATSTSLKAFEDALGSQPPLGFFDPLGLVEDGDQEKFDRLRYVEIKHGRICMLAFLGQITTRYGVHLPGDIDYSGDSFASYPNGWAAISGPDAIPSAGLAQIVAFVAALELGVMKDIEGTGNDSSVTSVTDPSTSDGTPSMKRPTAMMGILGLMVHEQLGGSVPIVGEL
eukprot:CAMPEP_0172408138 /NCGR_PEP_ID=MMETSP1061-20121228/75698_1 /TAXON_ID=37318 /ORGANISM="Pseudo-nitzschia pungens, Strain cf. pungens" /LENGTH=190 /DNA_ID=CAMNT_0013144257 /DNA_START=70 /DNA_END=643 /DNA_ORIENTATION=-